MERMWITAKKQKLLVRDMTTDHINNCMNMLRGDIKGYNKKILLASRRYVRDLHNTEGYSSLMRYTVQITVAKSYLKMFKKELRNRKTL